jgi:hypothetical protein
MRLPIVVSAALISAGVALFLYKIVVLDYPLTTADAPATWRVDFVVTASGQGGRATVDVPLPRSSASQTLLSEVVRSGRFRFSIGEEDGDRRGHWSGKLEGTTTFRYEVTFAALPVARQLPPHEARTTYPKSVSAYALPSPGIQSEDPIIAELARELLLDGSNKVKLATDIYEFVSREIASVRTRAPMDAVSVASESRGNAFGRARLFCALARRQGLPCRVVMGIVLGATAQDRFHYWNEAYLGDGWTPFDVVHGLAARLPANRLVLSTNAPESAVDSSATDTLSFRFDVQAESETYADLAQRRVATSPHLIDQLSPLFLPVHVQAALRFLLLVPLGALAMSVLRNVIGLRTFGMFMPVLIALAFTHTGLAWGTTFLAAIVTFALLSRLWIQRLYLLLAPRIAFTLTLVVLLMLALMLAGERAGVPTTGVGAFPFVIMTMIVERISVSLEEEGWNNTLRRVGSTVLAIYMTYAVIQARALQTFFLVFPEFLIVILGLLVIVGRYTGYRLTEIARFRIFERRPE